MKNLKPMSLPILLLLLLLSTDDLSHAQTQSKRIVQRASRIDLRRLQRLEVQFEQLRSVLRIPGMSAAIVKDQELLWAKGFGYADVEKQISASPNTLYYIASLTKTFATTVLLQLVEQGKLNLDEPMSKYSNEFKDDKVKVKHVLSHTSGGTPGNSFRYDGARFALLTSIIEKKTGKSFRQVIAEMFLDPPRIPISFEKINSIVTRERSLVMLSHTGSMAMRLFTPRIPGEESARQPAYFPQRWICQSSTLRSIAMCI